MAAHPEKANFETIYHYINDLYTATDPNFVRIPTYAIPDYPELSHELCGKALYYILNGVLDIMKKVWASYYWCNGNRPNLEHIFDSFFNSLKERGILDVFTLNYDILLDEFLKDANDGFVDSGIENAPMIFDPQEAVKRDKGLYNHVHGSVRFSKTYHHELLKYKGPFFKYDSPKWEELFPERSLSQSGEMIIPSPIITGMYKLENMQHEPFRTYHANLIHSINLNNVCIVIGYGFGDNYINAIIHSFLRRNNTKLIVITWEGMPGFLKKICEDEGVQNKILLLEKGFMAVASNPDDVGKICDFIQNT